MTAGIIGHGYTRKTMLSMLKRKLDDWLKSIDDENLRKACEQDVIVTGGAITSMLLGEKPNDYDVYFASYETTVRVARYYLDKFEAKASQRGGIKTKMFVEELKDVRGADRVRIVVQSAGVARTEDEAKPDAPDYQYFETQDPNAVGAQDYIRDVMDAAEAVDLEQAVEQSIQQQGQESKQRASFQPRFLSSNAITLDGGIQIVLRFYGEPAEIHTTYDFVHCTAWYRLRDRELQIPQKAIEATMSKTLYYQGSLYPMCSLFRIRKFIQRGWRINAGQILKICLQIQDLNLRDPKVMEDQLTGCDVAYFAQVMSFMNDKDPEKIDFAYLVEIIDRLF